MMYKFRIAFVELGQISQLNVPGHLQLPHCEVVLFCDLVGWECGVIADCSKAVGYI